MKFDAKELKPVIETSYLSAENTYRYRGIIRIMYIRNEQSQYWSYPEEIYQELKEDDHFNDYTLDECKRDLQALTDWKNVIAIQDTKRVKTLAEYRERHFRYQLSEYTVEIERMLLRLENLEVEGASLEPTLIEHLRNSIETFLADDFKSDEDLHGWWSRLNDEFTDLNQNYNDYLRTLNSADSEELMKTTEFLIYKDSIIDYLRKFVRSLQEHSLVIEQRLKSFDKERVEDWIQRLADYEMTIPRIGIQVEREQLEDRIRSKWENINRFFIGSMEQASEVERILDITSETIQKITQYAAQISEVYGQGINRRDDYLKLVELFRECQSLEEAHHLAALSFGVKSPVHLQGDFERATDSDNLSVYKEEPLIHYITPRRRRQRVSTKRTPITDYSEDKERQVALYLKKQDEERSLMEGFIHQDKLDFSELGEIDSHVRSILLTWLSKALENPKLEAQTEYGRRYRLEIPSDCSEFVELKASDGDMLILPFVFHFEEVDMDGA